MVFFGSNTPKSPGMQEEACGELTRNEGALPLLQRLRVALGLQAV